MIRGNKGEWSEIYTLFKLLGDGQLSVGDASLMKDPSLVFPILKIIRTEGGGEFNFSTNSNFVLISIETRTYQIPVADFENYASHLFIEIRKATGASFSVPVIENFMASYESKTIKAKSSSKTDIRIVIHDIRNSSKAELGFSIKSHLGSNSTLLNAGKSTNFIYKISGCSLSQDQILEINSINTDTSKIQNRVAKIESFGGKLEFVDVEGPVFFDNMVLVDSLLPTMMAKLVELFFSSKSSTIEDLVGALKKINPNNYNVKSSQPFYERKIKNFLVDAALGMTPAKVWDGQYDATGGYLIVKQDGEVLCYHIYYRNQFEEYLFRNTKLETASSTRHGFGEVYQKDGISYINLNLQIRFR